MAKPLLA